MVAYAQLGKHMIRYAGTWQHVLDAAVPLLHAHVSSHHDPPVILFLPPPTYTHLSRTYRAPGWRKQSRHASRPAHRRSSRARGVGRTPSV